MRTFLPIVFAALRGVELPFPDVKDPEPEPVVAAKPEPAPAVDTVSAPWTPPKAVEEDFASTSDAFAHPSAAVVKDWETAPKVEIFDTPTMEPMAQVSAVSEPKKAAALPVVHSSITPIVTTKQDDDPELAAIQNENPMAYGIVKALLLKKSMGLPLPGSQIQKHATVVNDGATHAASSSEHIDNMFNWKPTSTAADELAVTEVMSDVQQVQSPEEAPKEEAPAKEEVSAPEPVEAPVEPKVEAPVEPKVEAPVEAPVEPAENKVEEKPAALGSWLGVASQPAEPVQEQARPSMPKSNSVLSSYMADLA